MGTGKKSIGTSGDALAQILELSPSEVYVFDAQSWRFVYLNRSARENLGYTANEFCALTPLDIMPGMEPAQFKKILDPLARKEHDNVIFETTYERKSKSLYPAKAHLQSVTYNEKPCFVATAHDITSYKKKIDVLENFQEIVNDGYWDWKVQEGSNYTSARYWEMLGFDPDSKQPIVEEALNAMHEDDKDRVLAAMQRHFDSRGKVPYREEIRFKHKNGSYVSVLCRGKVVEWDDDGKPLRMIGAHADITKEKQREMELVEARDSIEIALSQIRKSEEHLNRTNRISRTGGWSLDVATQEMWWSDETFRIHDLPVGSKISVSEAINFYAEEARPIIAEAVQKGIEEGVGWDLELPFVTATNRNIWVRAMGERRIEPDGNVILQGTFQDITERKERERSLKAAREKADNLELENVEVKASLSSLTKIQKNLLSIFDEADDFIGMADDKGRIVYHNRSFNEITGKSEQGFGTMKIPDFHPLWAVELVTEKGIPYAIENGSWTGETAIYDRYQQEIPVLQTIIPHKDDSNNVVHLSTIMKDIRVIRDRENKLKEAKELSDAAARTKSQFLANMSHEIRTPMNGILGMTSLMREVVEDSELSRMLDTIERSGDALLTILDDILDFSKIEAGKLELESTAFSIRELVDDVQSLLKNQADERGVIIEVLIERSLPESLVGDPTRLRQVLTNLLSNAVKFSQNSNVRIELVSRACREPDMLSIQFSVKDHGIGMSSSQQTKLFQPFTQVDSSTTRRFGGTGLGLSISKAIIEAVGGSMWVESEEGVGSTFSFHWDFKETNQLSQAPATGQQQVFAMSILVVEDNSINREILQGLLNKLGYEADCATDGVEALESIEKRRYDLVLMDCQMPRVDGFEATRRIITEYGEDRPLIYALTASAMKEDKDRCTAAGMDGFLSKPIRKQLLKDLLLEVGCRLQSSGRSA